MTATCHDLGQQGGSLLRERRVGRCSLTRKALKAFDHQRFTIQATVARFGQKRGWRGATLRTILLLDVRRAQDGLLLTDHLWFTCGTTFDRLHLHPGDRIQFDARVAPYEKGYQGPRAEETGGGNRT